VLTYLPYYLMLDSQGISGLGLVTSPSAVGEFLLVYGFFMAVFWVAVLADLKKRPWLLLAAAPFVIAGYVSAAIAVVPLVAFAARKEMRAVDLLAVFGLAVIVFTELFFLMDGMGDVYYRMNTVFKFGLVAWMMVGTAAMAYVGGWFDAFFPGRIMPQGTRKAAILIIVGVLLVAPVVIPDLSYGYGGKTLDGLAWVELQHPGDAEALPCVSSLPAGTVILEAEGGDYSYYSRISSFTGVATVIGMPFHEQMWRGDEAMVGTRSADVRVMYEDPVRAPALYEAYGVDYVYVGAPEHEQYTVSLPEDALLPVWSGDEVVIYRVL
jgi:YYY domain-containing protein